MSPVSPVSEKMSAAGSGSLTLLSPISKESSVEVSISSFMLRMSSAGVSGISEGSSTGRSSSSWWWPRLPKNSTFPDVVPAGSEGASGSGAEEKSSTGEGMLLNVSGSFSGRYAVASERASMDAGVSGAGAAGKSGAPSLLPQDGQNLASSVTCEPQLVQNMMLPPVIVE